MDARQLLDQLVKERQELDSLIEGLRKRLGGGPRHASVTVRPKPHGKVWTPAERAAMSRKLKAVLAAKRRAKAAKGTRAKASKTAKKPKAASKPQTQS